jgi:PAS domain S-box-containing protein
MESASDPRETKQSARKRVRSVEAIVKSEEWLFTTLESVGDAVIATDANGMIVFMNPVAVRLTGWSEDDAQGRDCREVFRIVNETTRHETESPVTKVLRDGVISGLANHTILIARDGTEQNIDDSGSPIRSDEGELTGVVLIFRDITERRRIELTLHEQQEILQTLFDHIPVIVTFLDVDNHLTWANREFTRVTGWSLEEMRSTERLHYFFPPPHHSQGTIVAQEAPLGWRDFKLTLEHGRTLDISWATVRLSDGSIIGIGQDITERKRREEEKAKLLQQIESQNKRLEQAMRETDHRVKNNLQSIGALLDIQTMENSDMVPVKELSQVRMHITTLATIHDMLVRDVKGEGLARSLCERGAAQAPADAAAGGW